MTDIERLRALPAEWRKRAMNYDTTDPFGEGRAHSLEDCAEEIEEAGLSALLADYERLRGMEERVKGAPTAVAIYRSSTFLTNDPSNPRALIEKRDAWASLECHELPPEYAGQTVALVPVHGGEGSDA
jgi:hypothetical protein